MNYRQGTPAEDIQKYVQNSRKGKINFPPGSPNTAQ